MAEPTVDQLAINTIRFLAVDMVEAAQSGHPGAPLGQAPMAYLLWTRFLRHNPDNPDWPNRDRFVLSCGHASALLYALLHLAGYGLPIEELKRFRQFGSKTPGHPEHELTRGVETTTGPLGQGFGNGVGMAMAEKFLRERFGPEACDHHIFAICSDGDLMEGVSNEAASLAGAASDSVGDFYRGRQLTVVVGYGPGGSASFYAQALAHHIGRFLPGSPSLVVQHMPGAGGLLAAGGLGAILSPPVLGAAAFLIAEFLKISYLDVILMATVPTILYYLAIFAMVEIDARKFAMAKVVLEKHQTALVLAKRYWYHFASLIAIVVFMLMGYSPGLSVFWATLTTAVLSFIHRDTAIIPYEWFRGRLPWVKGLWGSGLVKALEGGSVSMLNVAMTCASAGIIVGVVTLTGLGLKFSSIVLDYADSGADALVTFWTFFGADATPVLLHDMRLLLTAFYTSLIVWIVGLAVPVTASYIICAVIAAPAMIKLGVPDFAAHMFIFYYAVLSEVSPPTALSPFAAAAITGGGPYRTTMQCWKYTTPAFLIPFMFVLDPSGTGLLLTGSFKTLGQADWGSILRVTITAAFGVVALAGGLQGWLFHKTTILERWLLIIAGVLLVYPAALCDYIGAAMIGITVVLQKLRSVRIKAAAR